MIPGGTWIMFQASAPAMRLVLCVAALLSLAVFNGELYAQAGLRESLENLDRDRDGEISPNEITPRARPYLERIARARRMSLDRPNSIERLQEAARVYHAMENGVSGEEIDYEGESSIQPFGPRRGEPLVPEFGLPEVKYPYMKEDLDEAKRTLWRYDRNRDGFVDRNEAARSEWTHRDPFEMDLNKDDRLDRLELAQRYARRRLLSEASGELIRKAWRTRSMERYSSRDDDRDENSNRRRWGDSRQWLSRSLLERFDANRSGRLEMNETAQLGIPAGRIDVDRDGELSRDELQAFVSEMQDEAGGFIEGLPGWFYELDANRDRQVALAEFAEEWTDDKLQEFELLDTNGDGLLTPLEVIQSKSLVGGTYQNQTAEVLAPRKTVISEIEVTDDYVIADLNVQLSITHTHTAYLDAYLTGPDGQRIELFEEVGREGDHFDQTILDDQAQYPINKARPPFRGSFIPEAAVEKKPSLSYFNGKSVKGVWQLVIRGSRNTRYGMLHNWSLIVRPEEDLPSDSATP
jgi:subtilisin-like proprotein convertase family protein